MKNTVLVFGEILYDIFGSERKLGGAPLNFGCHFANLGGDAVMISAVGRDGPGTEALAEARSYGVDTSHVAFSRKPTGYCLVTLKDGAPSYDLVYPVAYDCIRFKELPYDAQGVYFGTLAQRGGISRRFLWKLLENTRAKAFFDINIRQNFYTKSIIDRSLKRCDVLKVSREESGVFKTLGLCRYDDPEDISKSLAEKYSIGTVVVTLDKDGAFVYEAASGKTIYSRKPQSKPVSTVGAGDSFSAAFFHGMLGGLSTEECLDRAITLSDYVVTVVGAVCRYPEELKQRLGI
ncbi:MAG: hypothetical protein IJK33_06860 [Clostridia bacterium]|nr:hypothetical protein [Clostridia bacterium]